ncbi:MAG: Gfo/Idh/MocA family oxidoreductase [Candidatus Sumerlaeia bacterium]
MSKPMEAVLIGAGQRGFEAFGGFALRNPGELKFVAVCDPVEARRRRFADAHGIAPDCVFERHEDLLAMPQLAPLCVNATMDRDHLPTALAAMERGYHLLLEKPMAATAGDCLQIAARARALGRMLQIVHPLRYTPLYRLAKDLLDGGAIGRIVSISMAENIAYWHFAHSYVRGNWRRQDQSGPMILTKCCHDMDIAAWLAGVPVRRVASFGSLTWFRPENRPPGAPDRCLDGCPVEQVCAFSAPALYLGPMVEWPVSVISVDRSLEARRQALQTGPYGRCVYACDNDVADHQVVVAEFENGVTLDFTARAHTNDCFRTLRVFGADGELNAHFEKNEVSVTRFGQRTGEPRHETIHRPGRLEGAHGGGDTGVIRNVLRLIRDEAWDEMNRSLQIAVEAHLLAFAAELARRTGTGVEMAAFRRQVQESQ